MARLGISTLELYSTALSMSFIHFPLDYLNNFSLHIYSYPFLHFFFNVFNFIQSSVYMGLLYKLATHRRLWDLHTPVQWNSLLSHLSFLQIPFRLISEKRSIPWRWLHFCSLMIRWVHVLGNSSLTRQKMCSLHTACFCVNIHHSPILVFLWARRVALYYSIAAKMLNR